MNTPYRPGPVVRLVRDLPEHLGDLAEQMARLSSRVREAIVEAVGESLAGAAKDLLQRGLVGPALVAEYAPRPTSAWSYDDDDEADWPGPGARPPEHRRRDAGERTTAEVTPTVALAALGLQAAGWWLHSRGAWLGAACLGLGIGGVALAGGRFAVAGLSAVRGLHEVLALHHALRHGAMRLSGS